MPYVRIFLPTFTAVAIKALVSWPTPSLEEEHSRLFLGTRLLKPIPSNLSHFLLLQHTRHCITHHWPAAVGRAGEKTRRMMETFSFNSQSTQEPMKKCWNSDLTPTQIIPTPTINILACTKTTWYFIGAGLKFPRQKEWRSILSVDYRRYHSNGNSLYPRTESQKGRTSYSGLK